MRINKAVAIIIRIMSACVLVTLISTTTTPNKFEFLIALFLIILIGFVNGENNNERYIPQSNSRGLEQLLDND